MKKFVAIVLLLVLVLTACSTETGYDDHFTHNTPEEMQDYEKILLERADFAEHIESVLNIRAYPDLLILDEAGTEVVGMYIYDPETGLATGWTNLATGEKTMYKAGEEVDLGKPDPKMMIDFQGTVKLGFAVYQKDGNAMGAELYFFLSEAADATLLTSYMEDYYGEVPMQESETVYKIVKDEKAIQDDFAAEVATGANYFEQNAESYLSILKLNYGVTPVA